MDNSRKDLTADALPRNARFGGSSFFGMDPVGARAVRPLPLPAVFPNGARAAALLTFDCEGTYGNGAGDMDLEVRNYFRICDRLEALGLKATFNIVGRMAEEQGPDFVKRIHAAGAEVAAHGYTHEMTHVGPAPYHGHYGPRENVESLRRGRDCLQRIIDAPVRGVRVPYGHFNEHTYAAIESLGLDWTSNMAIEDLLDPAQGFGPAPFTPALGDREYRFVEIPVDCQTFDWAIWIADEANPSFVERVRKYADARGIALLRAPSGAAAIWKERIRQTIGARSVFTFLCHPINLAVSSHRWGDPVEEFLFPVFDDLGRRQDAGELWVPTCGEMADFYRAHVADDEREG